MSQGKRGRPRKDASNNQDAAKAEVYVADVQGDTIEISPPVTIDVARQEISANPNRFGMTEKGLAMMLEVSDGDVTQETVSQVEAALGRRSNAWGMVDPVELIRAVDRVLRGGEG
jgi:hypothetical protein